VNLIDCGQQGVKQDWQKDYKSSGRNERRRTQPALGFAGQLEPVGVIHQSIQDGISQSWVRDALVPGFNGNLGHHDGGSVAIAIIKNIEQILGLNERQRIPHPIIQNDKIKTSQGSQELGVRSISMGQLQIL